MHKSRADGSDESLAIPSSDRKRNKDVPPGLGSTNSKEARFFNGMISIREDIQRTATYRLYVRLRNAMLQAFFRIAVIPIESIH